MAESPMYPDTTATDSSPRGVSELFRRVEDHFAHESGMPPRRRLIRVPARLDVLGGIADYSGALVIGSTLSIGVTVTVQLRNDDRIIIHGQNELSDSGHPPLEFTLNDVQADSVPVLARSLPDVPWLKAAVGAVCAMVASGKIEKTSRGATIAVDGEITPLLDAGITAAVAVAVLMTLIDAWGLRFDPVECAQLAMRADNELVGLPCGIGAAFTVLHGSPRGLLRVRCDDSRRHEDLPLPDDLTVVGIDCQNKSPDAGEKYVSARVAASMGRHLIDRIIRAPGGPTIQWKGMLAQIPVDDYVNHLRDRIPTKIKGADFLEHLGETGDPLTRIDPETIYKIRSRTEHHIYESQRTRKFAKLLTRAIAKRDRAALLQAGDLMFASHWSYGQRCGLGSVETDRLVTILRKRRAESGIYGARISGHGGGGIVVALIENTQRTRDALDQAIEEYTNITGRDVRILEGGSPGAIQFGVHEC